MPHPLSKSNSGPYAPAYQRLLRAIEEGAKKHDELLAAIRSMVIKDRLVHPKTGMKFVVGPLGLGLRLEYSNGLEPHTIHDHALGQIVKVVEMKLGMGYVRELLEPGTAYDEPPTWRANLLVDTLNRIFANRNFGQKGDPRFLHRIVGTELRGFVSRRFNLHLASAPLLQAFIGVCAEHGAVPLDAKVTPLEFELKCFLPEVFEPFPGEFVCIGTAWRNSDFGTRRMRVSTAMWRAKGKGFVSLSDVLSKAHIGKELKDLDLDDVEVSEKTAKKVAEAHASYIVDAVQHQLGPDQVGKILGAIEEAHQQQIPWDRLHTQLKKIITARELEEVERMHKSGVEDLPPVVRSADVVIPTRWWVSSVLARLAEEAETADRSAELQRISGKVLVGEVVS